MLSDGRAAGAVHDTLSMNDNKQDLLHLPMPHVLIP
jgi:hypothetical protein